MATVNVIQAGDPTVFDMLAFPEQSPANQVYIENQLSQFSNTVTDIGKAFLDASKDIYQKVNDSNAIRAARAALRTAKGIFHPNVITQLETLDDIRAAQPTMQKYVMAYPEIRDVYHKQRCDGYSDTYRDMEPNYIGEDQYDYRRIMSGMVVETDDGWECTTYAHDDLDGDRDLTVDEKVDILNTWDLIQGFMDAGEDVTDIYDGKLN